MPSKITPSVEGRGCGEDEVDWTAFVLESSSPGSRILFSGSFIFHKIL